MDVFGVYRGRRSTRYFIIIRPSDDDRRIAGAQQKTRPGRVGIQRVISLSYTIQRQYIITIHCDIANAYGFIWFTVVWCSALLVVKEGST
jgi:hypothetical protein